jgi:hypothetical protein
MGLIEGWSSGEQDYLSCGFPAGSARLRLEAGEVSGAPRQQLNTDRILPE